MGRVRTGPAGAVLRGTFGTGLLAVALLAGCSGKAEAPPTSVSRELILAPSGGSHPTVAIDGRDGTTFVAWVALDRGTGAEGENDVLLVRVLASGELEAAIRVNDQPGDATPHEQAPAQVAAGPRGEVYVVWQRRVAVEGRRFGSSKLRFARSLDGGRSFEPAYDLADYSGPIPASHTFHNVLVLSDGRVVVAWLDGREQYLREAAGTLVAGEEPGPEVRVAVSGDRGATFGPSVVVAREVCPCCRTALAQGPDGELVVGWRHIREAPGGREIRDPSVASSRDGGVTWSAPVAIAEDGWVHDGCPHAGPALAFDASGGLHALRYTGNPGVAGVHHAVRAPGAEEFGAPEALLEGEWVPPSRVALVRLGDGGLSGAWEDGTTDPATFVEGRFPEGGGVDPATVRRTAGRYPALAAAGPHRSLVWVRGEEVLLRTEGPSAPEPRAEAPASGRFRRLAAGDPAPDWNGTLLDGSAFRMADLRGRVTLLTVWATWCTPCRKEMPALQTLSERFGGDGLEVVGVSVDDPFTAGQIPPFLAEFGIRFPIAHDPDETVTRAFMTMGVPESFLIGRDGTLLHRWVGAFDPAAPAEEERIRSALGL